MKARRSNRPLDTPEAQAWLREHPEVNPDELAQVWEMATHAEPVEEAAQPLDMDRIARLRAALVEQVRQDAGEASRTARSPRRRPRARILPLWVRVAAVVLILVGGGLVYATRPVQVTAPLAAMRAVSLPDESQVTLNSGASLSYRRFFGWTTRTVKLDGEAFFEVVRGEVPFQVHTANAAITVLGTRFNVRTWLQGAEPATEVMLEEGQVQLAGQEALGEPVVLAPGQRSRVVGHAPPTVPEAVPVDRVGLWRTGGFLFNNQPVGVILDEVGRRFGVRIQTHPDVDREEIFNLYLDHAEDVETLLDMVCTPLGYTYQAVGSGYEVRGTPAS